MSDEAYLARREELEREFIGALTRSAFTPLAANRSGDDPMDPVLFLRRLISREGGQGALEPMMRLIANTSRTSTDPQTRLECSSWLAGAARLYASTYAAMPRRA